MCPIVTAIDEMIQVYSIYIIYIVYMLNLTDYVHHCVCTNELSNLCLVREQLNSYKVNHSFFVRYVVLDLIKHSMLPHTSSKQFCSQD